MNTTAQTPKRGLSSRCSAFADLLPLLDSPGLAAEEDAAVRAHLGSCAACQAQRAAYYQMTLEARRSLSPAATTRRHQTEELLASIMEEIPAAPETGVSSPPRHTVKLHRPIRPRRLIAGLAPLAAVVVLVVVAATLFASHPRPGGKTGNSPQTPKGSMSALTSISMVSAEEGWAVGAAGPCDANPINAPTLVGHCQTTDPLVMHYQHGQWTPVPVSFQGTLDTISMLSATDGWAGGNHLFVHYDGHTWKPMPTSNQVTLSSLHMLSDTDGWALGFIGKTYAILHYDGQTWTAQPLPASLGISQQHIHISDLAMISPTEGWFVGTLDPATSPSADPTKSTAVILHYANGQWTLQSSTKHADLEFISMSSATDGWATGTSYTNNSGYYSESSLLLHYTQGNWTEVKSSNTNNAGAISMSSASDGWAVGDSEGDNGLLITDLLHYNGQQWTTVPAFTSRYLSVNIVALQMLSATEGWAVGSSITYGSQHDSNGNQLILSWTAVIVQYHNGAWSIVPAS